MATEEQIRKIQEKINQGRPITIEENRQIQESQRPTQTKAKTEQEQREALGLTERPSAIRSKIIVDENTGEQVAAQIYRGPTQKATGLRSETEVETVMIENGNIVQREVTRGIPEFVRQEAARIERERFPKVITQREMSQRELEEKERQKLMNRGYDIETQLSSGLVREDKQKKLLSERDKILSKLNYVPEGVVSYPPIQEGKVNYPKSGSPNTPPQGVFSKDVRKDILLLSKPKSKKFIDIGGRNEPLTIGGNLNFLSGLNVFSQEPTSQVEAQLSAALIPLGQAIPGPYDDVALKAASKSPSLVKTIGRSGVKLVTKAFKSPVAKRVVRGLVGTYLVQKTSEEVGKATASKEQINVIRKLRNMGLSEDALYSEALAAGDMALAQSGALGGINPLSFNYFGERKTVTPKGIIRELPTGTLYFDESKKAETKYLKDTLKQRGLSDKEVNTFINYYQRQKKFQAFGEVAGALNIERTSESVGRELVGQAFLKQSGKQVAKKKVFGQVFKTTAPRIAAAGVLEGAFGEFFQRQSRGRPQDIRALGVSGALGGVTAGLLGGTIAASRPTKPGLSRTLAFGADIIDPLEKPGDLLQDFVEASSARLRRTSRLVPTITPSFGGQTFQFGINTNTNVKTFAREETKKKKPSAPQRQPNYFETLVNQYEQEQQQRQQQYQKQNQRQNNFQKQFQKQQEKQNEFIKQQQKEQQKQMDEMIKQQEQFQQNINQQFNTFVSAPTNVPTTVPRPLFPPPFLGPLPGGLGGPGSRVGKRVMFVDELRSAFNLLSGSIPQSLNLFTGKRPTKKRTTKKKKIKRQK